MSSTDKLINLRRTQQDLYQYPTSSKWYMTLSKAISFFELAETSTNALDRFRNFWSALYNLFILYGKVGEDEINRYHFWIKDSINIPEFRTIAQEKNWQKFLADIEKTRKILFFDSHRAKWREANQILDSWQKAAEKNIDTNDRTKPAASYRALARVDRRVSLWL